MRPLLWCAICLTALDAFAQGALIVRVEDPSGATIPHAQVVVLADAVVIADETADARGLATIAVSRPGPLTVIVSAPGFAPARRVVTTAPGEAPGTITVPLAIAAIETGVAVSVEDRSDGVTDTLSQAEIDQLPDDPDELQLVLEDLAGPEATIQVDGFTGGRLPDRDEIARIVIRRDAYSAEFHRTGRGRVEISTRPGLDGWRGNAGLRLRPSGLSARNAAARGARAGTRIRMNVFAAGPLVRNRVSVSGELEGTSAENVRGISALSPGGPIAAALTQPFDDRDVSVRSEGLLSDHLLLRAGYRREQADRGNQGISELDLPERGYRRETVEHELRFALEGGRLRPFHVRLQMDRRTDAAIPDTIAPAIVVQNAFRSGGASVAGSDRQRQLLADTMFTLVNRPYTLRVGSLVTWVRNEQGQLRNTLGTFTFTDLDRFSAGRPATFTQRMGARPIDFAILQGAAFAQAEFARGGWTFGLGARHEWHRGQAARPALAPRFGVSRTFQRDRTMLRAGYGWFNGWIPTRLEEETIRLSQASSEEELIVRSPGFPDPFGEGTVGTRQEPPTRLTLAETAHLPRWQRASVGVTHQVRPGLRIDLDTYYERTASDFRSIDLNAPIDGLRPDMAFGRVLLLRSIGRSDRGGVNLGASLSPRQGVFSRVRYAYDRSFNDADDALTPPPGGTFDSEWGPARGAPRHRLFWHVGAPIARWGLSVSVTGRLQSGTPYNVTTGRDDNGDAIFNDRPAGTPRNSRRGAATIQTDARLTWTVRSFRPSESAAAQRGPVGRRGPGGARRRDGRRVEMFLSVSNVFNRVNETSYVGVLTSPLFGQPTSTQAARRVELGWRVVF